MSNYLYRTAKFEVKPNDAQLHALLNISEVMRRIWNLASTEREDIYTNHFAPIYTAIKSADESGNKKCIAKLKKELRQAMKDNAVSGMSQGKNLLTPLRRSDESVAYVTRKWQEGTLFDLEGAMKSYFRLKKNGDPKARRPRCKPEGWFQEITCKGGFKLNADVSAITLACKKVASNDVMTFPIPKYQQSQLGSGIAKEFTLYRDERDLGKPGRYWMSISFAIPAPEELPSPPEKRVYLALGSSAIAILAPPTTPDGEWRKELITVPRPDRYWKPRIDSVSSRMKKLYRKDREQQSIKYRKLQNSRKEMFKKLQAQQTLAQRTLVQYLLRLAPDLHFVVTELVVRSKKGKLANAKDSSRRGTLGQNWSAQNTGWLTNLLAWLKIKASERGSTVQTFRLLPPHPRNEDFATRKQLTAQLLRQRYLESRAH
jgi:hypothetical protein